MQTDSVPLVARDGFLELVRSGISVHEVARRMGCSRAAVRIAARKLNALTPRDPQQVGVLLEAPSDEEEIISQSTLALAPSVELLAREVRRRAIAAYIRGERSPYARKV
jgi:transposase-like protein